MLCRIHLRAVAGAVGLKNNVSNSLLIERLRQAKRSGSRGLLRLQQGHPGWFRLHRRCEVPGDSLIIYRFPHALPPFFEVQPAVIMERFCGVGSWQTWLENGTLTVPGFLSYLDDPEIRHLMDEDFALYRHHHQVPSGKARMGWLHHMFYSAIQQLVRMDIVWYAINVACRPDKAWRLISFPYITKDTDPGESTGFLHLDLNAARFMQDGSGGSLISSSISLDDESDDNCTLVVPGFHKHIAAWHHRVEARGAVTNGATTNCATLYRPEDQEAWGKPIPQPCPALGLRVTLPTLIHGSTATAGKRRRTLFAWYTGIAEDHETLYDHDSLSWSEVAACHRDLRIPRREPANCVPKHAIPEWAFPASQVLERVSPLAAALVGARRWTDPAVLQERNILLGPDNAAALDLAASVRAKLKSAYIRQHATLVEAEMQAYGDNSYFRQKGTKV